jgi:hypothetical protein
VRWECDPVRIIVGAAKWQRTVGTAGVVMLRVFLEHGAQVSLTDHEHPVGALSPYRPDPAFGVRVPFSGTAVPIFFLDDFRAEQGIERVSELAIAVTDREAERSGALTKVSRRSAWPAGSPNAAFGISSDTEDADTAYLPPGARRKRRRD